MQKALQIFKRKLTNLSSANPYLWMRRLKADFFLDIADIEPVTSISGWAIMDQILSGKKTIALCPIADSRDHTNTVLSQKISGLLKKQKLQIQERGVNDLHLAFLFVLGKWPDGSWVRTPLLLIPVEIGATQKTWNLAANLDESFINPAFLLAYAFHFQQSLEHQFFDKELDLEAEDGISFLTRLYERLKNSKLEIHFNQALFSKKIEPFLPLSKETLPTEYQPGMLKLQPEAVLGLFPQSDSVLIPDFEFLEEKQIELEDIFLKQIDVNQTITEKNLFCPLPMDGSQEDCIRHIKRGNSLVVQGPPGTGKSQLIANLMADAIGRGQSVLLVCQKKVALEVVRKRLSEIGLGDFIGLWADFKNDKNQIFNQLASQIDKLDESEKQNQQLDTVVLERNFALACQAIDRISQNLENWKEALYQTETSGISAHELYHSVAANHNFDSEYLTQFRLEEWNEFKDWFSKSYESVFLTKSPDFELAGRSNWFDLAGSDFENIRSQLIALSDQTTSLTTKIEKAFHTQANWEKHLERIGLEMSKYSKSYTRIAESKADFLILNSPEDWQSANYLKSTNEGLRELELLGASLDLPSDISYNTAEIDALLEILHRRSTFYFYPMVFQILKMFIPDLKKVEKSLLDHHLKSSETASLKNILQTARKWIVLQQKHIDKENTTITQSKVDESLERIAAYHTLKSDIELLATTLTVLSTFVKGEMRWPLLNTLAEMTPGFLSSAEKIRKTWSSFFPAEHQISDIPLRMNQRLAAFDNHKDHILKADKMLSACIPQWKVFMLELVNIFSQSEKSKAAIQIEIDEAWKQAWIKKLEQQMPVLTEPGTALWAEELNLLRQKIEEKNQLVIQILKLRLRENTYKNMEFNRLGNRVTYRDLQHQVSKKRQRFPMRQLWEMHGNDIQKLIPAWLATPESVSATWPMENTFDLVIFDEASQCFAEKGIAAAYRGKQLVIVGDDKQLPPHQLFSSRWEEDSEEESLFSEQDSLLDLAKQFLPQKMLTSHYRSLYPELISFSNLHFYQQKLEVIPLPSALLTRKPAIRFLKTDGKWINQRNEPEAIFLVEEVLTFLSENGSESVGIISFNAKQQLLIETLLETTAARRGIILPESLFIKNIENVQGDERDHIWFSIGYARNEQGKVVSQFGSLSISGGENRLNVAISRAKKSIVVVSSILPEELPVSNQSAIGPQLLQKFLFYTYQLSNAGEIHYQQNEIPDTKTQPQPKPLSGEVNLELPFSDHAILHADASIRLFFNDGKRVAQNGSMKDHFGLKYMALSSKGYHVRYEYSRRIFRKND